MNPVYDENGGLKEATYRIRIWDREKLLLGESKRFRNLGVGYGRNARNISGVTRNLLEYIGHKKRAFGWRPDSNELRFYHEFVMVEREVNKV